MIKLAMQMNSVNMLRQALQLKQKQKQNTLPDCPRTHKPHTGIILFNLLPGLVFFTKGY